MRASRKNILVLFTLATLLPLLLPYPSHAEQQPQTPTGVLAPAPTGSNGTITAPNFPTTTCQVLNATATLSNAKAANSAADTSTIQTALKNCSSGAVELIVSGSNTAFVSGPLYIPSGVTLQVDAGVTLLASPRPSDFDNGGGECGKISSPGNSCYPFLTTGSSLSGSTTTGSGIMGFGVIDGRGQDTLYNSSGVAISNTGTVFAGQSHCGTYLTWYCMDVYANANGEDQNNPKLLSTLQASSFNLYKITLMDSPFWTVAWAGSDSSSSPTTNLDVWESKILAPYWAVNTDGIDPVNNVSNVLIHDSYISNGDDNIAISASYAGKPAQNMTVSNLHTYSGRGVSIGSETAGGINNILFDNIYQSGYYNPSTNDLDPNSVGFRVKSNKNFEGIVYDVLLENSCQQNETTYLGLEPFWDGNSTTGIYPVFGINNSAVTGDNDDHPIQIDNLTIVPGVQTTKTVQLQGYSSTYFSLLYLSNVQTSDSSVITVDSNAENLYVYITPDSSTSHLDDFTGTDVYHRGTSSPATAYSCPATSFPPVDGEIFISVGSSGTNTNKKSHSTNTSTPFTLNAVFQEASEDLPYALSGAVTFHQTLNGVTTQVSGTPTTTTTSSGTLYSLSLTLTQTGDYTFYAEYPSQGSNYPYVTDTSYTVSVTVTN